MRLGGTGLLDMHDAEMRGAARPFRGLTQHLDACRVLAFQSGERQSGSAVLMLQQPRELLRCAALPKRCPKQVRCSRNLAFVEWRRQWCLLLLLALVSQAEAIRQADAASIGDRPHFVLAVGVECGKSQLRHVGT